MATSCGEVTIADNLGTYELDTILGQVCYQGTDFRDHCQGRRWTNWQTDLPDGATFEITPTVDS